MSPHNNEFDAAIPIISITHDDEDVEFKAECKDLTTADVESTGINLNPSASKSVPVEPWPINAECSQKSSVAGPGAAAIFDSGIDSVEFEAEEAPAHDIADSNMDTFYNSDIEHADNYDQEGSAENNGMYYKRDQVAIAVVTKQPVAGTETQETVRYQETETDINLDKSNSDLADKDQKKSVSNNVNFESAENDAISCEGNYISTAAVTEKPLTGSDDQESFIKPDKNKTSF